MKKCCIAILSLFSSAVSTFAQASLYREAAQQAWVDSIFQSLTLEQKIGQLFFMVAVPSDRDREKRAALEGLHMRLDSTLRYPWAMTLGAVRDTSLLRSMGRQIASQCKRMGIHVNFAPDAGVNTNLKNPIIGNRSFGDDPRRVAAHALAYARDLQQRCVLACAKHFPDHGDSHETLPIASHSRAHLNRGDTDVEFYPFVKLIQDSVAAVMTAHLYAPALTPGDSTPTSVSKEVIT